MINYTKKTWKDEPDHTTPITAYELNQREQAFENLATQKLDISQTQNLTGLQKSVAIANLGLPDGMHFIGYVETTEDLPTDAHNGDYYEVREDGHTYIWNGEEWVDRGVEGTSNVVKYVPQTLTSAEQSQARNNIGAGTSSFSGNYNDLSNKPTLATVATSGNYNDLSNKPSIPSKTSDLTNDSNFVSDSAYVHTDNNYTSAEKTSVGQITGIKNDLTQLDVHTKELQILGWQVPDGCPVQNEISGDNLIQKVGRFNLGSMNWGLQSTYQVFYPLNPTPLTSINQGVNNTFIDGYTFTPNPWTAVDDKHFMIQKDLATLNEYSVVIHDSDYNNESVFQSAMSDKYIYYELATPITHSISNNFGLSNEALDIKMLGWSVPKECPIQNYMDNNRRFHQRVGRVDLGSLSWSYYSNQPYGYPFFYSTIEGMKDSTNNLYLMNYIVDTSDGGWITLDKAMKASNPFAYNEINIADFGYTDATAFKSAMQGVYLYYELATEIVTNVDGNEAIFNPLSGELKFIAGRVNWDGVPEIFTIEQYSMYVVFACTATQRAIYLVNGIGAQAAAVKVAGDDLASFSLNGFTVTANINRYCGYAIYRLMLDD